MASRLCCSPGPPLAFSVMWILWGTSFRAKTLASCRPDSYDVKSTQSNVNRRRQFSALLLLHATFNQRLLDKTWYYRELKYETHWIWLLPFRGIMMKEWCPVASSRRPPLYVTGAFSNLRCAIWRGDQEEETWRSEVKAVWSLLFRSTVTKFDGKVTKCEFPILETCGQLLKSLVEAMYWTFTMASGPNHFWIWIRPSTHRSFLVAGSFNDRFTMFPLPTVDRKQVRNRHNTTGYQRLVSNRTIGGRPDPQAEGLCDVLSVS